MSDWKKFVSELSIEEDRFVGLIFGLALGDAIGAINEHQPPQSIDIPLDVELATTDETEQMLIFMQSMCANQRINPADLTHRLIDWANSDVSADRPAPDKITEMLLKSPAYLVAPWTAATNLWKQSNGKFASSHALSRVAILGVLLPDTPIRENVTIGITQLTHADSRCSVAACYYVNMLHRYAVRDFSPSDVNLPSDLMEIINNSQVTPITEFELHKRNTSFVYLAIAVLEWTSKVIDFSRNANTMPSFMKVIKTVAECGGDADNNCAVAGSLLGVWIGYKKLPKSITRLLSTRKELRNVCQQWIAIQRIILETYKKSLLTKNETVEKQPDVIEKQPDVITDQVSDRVIPDHYQPEQVEVTSNSGRLEECLTVDLPVDLPAMADLPAMEDSQTTDLVLEIETDNKLSTAPAENELPQHDCDYHSGSLDISVDQLWGDE